MVIDNHTYVIKSKLKRFTVAIIAGISTVIFFTFDKFEIQDTMINSTNIIVLIVSLYIVFVTKNYIKDLNYIYFNDETDKIVFRYYTLRPTMLRKNNSIEINKKLFRNFRIENKFLGFKQQIIFTQENQTGIVDYPPVSISSLSKEQVTNLNNALKKHIKK